MSSSPGKRKKKGGKKVRVAFRQNRSKPPRTKNWTQQLRDAGGQDFDTHEKENVQAKGDLSRRRTIIVPDGSEAENPNLRRGVVIAMRGLFAEVDDGTTVWLCTVRRVLRTRLIEERHPVTIGDRVRFALDRSGGSAQSGGVIESVESRHGQLRRRVGRRVQTIAVNVDQVIIVTSARQPRPKAQLIDRYIVSALAGGITPIVCMNKIDLDEASSTRELTTRYEKLGYAALRTSARTGEGIDEMNGVLRDKASVIVGQSGVGKSSLLNVVEPTLRLKTAHVMEHTEKGRHTTTTASLIRLSQGGYVVDTPGIRSFDLSIIARNEFEAYFVEFVEHLAHCKFPNCTHTHEQGCAVKEAVEQGKISQPRYESYVHLFEEAS